MGGIARSLALADAEPDYRVVERKSSGLSRRHLRAYLGTIPAYGQDEAVKGVKLQGAVKGAPAELAGIQGGDMLIGLAGVEVETIHDFMNALAGLKVGETTEMIVLRDIGFESHCEHHMAPIIGRAHVGYLPRSKVVGISKLARVVEAYARRFQVQEKMTAQIANCIHDVLQPKGVAVVIEASHQCMTTRGIHKSDVSMVTSQMIGGFRKDARTRAEFLRMIDTVR